MKTVIRNGKLATAEALYYGDISISDGMVQKIGQKLKGSFDKEIDASGKIVIPGGIDVHTHFNLHTGSAVARDDFYTGTAAAACGGTTCIVDHMGFGPEGCNLKHQLQVYHQYADDNAVIDYSFHGVLQHVDQDILSQLEDMVIDEGISSFKIYMTYDNRLADSDISKVMEVLKKLNAVTAIHAESHDIIQTLRREFINAGHTSAIYHAYSRPPHSESEAVGRAISLASTADNAPLYIVHLSSKPALELMEAAKKSGVNVYAETCPQYLLLDRSLYDSTDNQGLKYILSPPLRHRKHCEALWQGIREGFIQIIATDHCPFSFAKDKLLGRDDFTKCPNGLPGVEERIPLMFSEGVMKNRISISKLVQVCCTNPAKLFGLYPKKGVLMPGSDADIVIIDPDKDVRLTQGMLHSNVDYTAYEGFQLKGYPVMTISRGEIIAENNDFVGSKGRGRFLKRSGFIYNQI